MTAYAKVRLDHPALAMMMKNLVPNLTIVKSNNDNIGSGDDDDDDDQRHPCVNIETSTSDDIASCLTRLAGAARSVGGAPRKTMQWRWKMGNDAGVAETSTAFDEMLPVGWCMACRILCMLLLQPQPPPLPGQLQRDGDGNCEWTPQMVLELKRATAVFYWLSERGEVERLSGYDYQQLAPWQKAFICSAMGDLCATMLCLYAFNRLVDLKTLGSDSMDAEYISWLRTALVIATRATETIKNVHGGRDDVGFAIPSFFAESRDHIHAMTLFYEAFYYFTADEREKSLALSIMYREIEKLKRDVDKVRPLLESRSRLVSESIFTSLKQILVGHSDGGGSGGEIQVLPAIPADKMGSLQLPLISRLFLNPRPRPPPTPPQNQQPNASSSSSTTATK
jgi:hypothetical protein